MQLRDYQDAGVNEIRQSLAVHNRVLYVAPCGSGKTQVFSYISKHASNKNNTTLILVHRRELIKQTSSALNSWGVSHGIISPDYRQTFDDVQVASVQTVVRRLGKIPAPKLIIVDECHHSTSKTYKKILGFYPDIKIIGFTASPARTDGQGLGQVYQTMITGPTVQYLIDNGYLSPFIVYAPPQAIDLSDVHTRAGDYAIEEIAVKMDKASICGDVIQHYRRYLNGAPAIIFCVTVAHAKHVAEQFASEGFHAAAVYGDMPNKERDETMSALKDGKLNIVTSCALVDEGFDAPAVHGVILLRPTKSLVLHTQQMGRAIRICEGKSQAIVLDHVNNCGKLGLPTQPIAWTLDGKNKASIKGPSQCKRCYKVFYGRPLCTDIECPTLRAAPGKDAPKFVDGELQELEDPYAWTKGIDIARAKGEEWKALLHHAAGDLERLKQIQKIRNYDYRWIRHQMGNHSSTGWRRKA